MKNHTGIREPRQFGNAKLPKKNIINLDNDFKAIRQDGVYRGGRLMTIGVLSQEDIGFKVAFIAGKRVHRRANKRNLAKRRLREVTRLTRAAIHEDNWIVIIAKPAIFNASVYDIQREFIYLAKKVSIWNENFS